MFDYFNPKDCANDQNDIYNQIHVASSVVRARKQYVSSLVTELLLYEEEFSSGQRPV